MYITCPKCNANFAVSPEQIGRFGRKVKCSRCSNIWYQTLKHDMQDESIISPPIVNAKFQPKSGINLPALLPIKIPGYLYIMPIVLTLLIISLSIVLFQDSFGIKSLTNENKFNINDIYIDNSKKLNKMTISYKIVNTSDSDAYMPLVRVRLFDKNNTIIKSHIASRTNINLAPKQYVTIKTEFDSVPDTTQHVDITLGNRLDFILR